MPRLICTALTLIACAGTASAQVPPPTPFQDFGAIEKSDILNPDGFFSIDTCGSDFDTEIGLWDRRGQLVAFNDDADSGPCVGSLQSFLNLQFPPGVYYFSVSGFNTTFGPDFVAATDTGSLGGNAVVTLDVESGLQTLTSNATIAQGDGVNTGEVKFFRFIVPGVFEATDLGTVSTDGFVEVDTCGSDFDTEIGVWNLDTGELIDFNDDADAGPCSGSLQSQLNLRLPTGRYALSVSGFQTVFRDGFVAETGHFSNSGNAAGQINGFPFADEVSEGGEAEWYTFDVVALPAGALSDSEPDCFPGYVDTTNGGCFNGGDFGSLALGQTVNGSAGPVEQDWYEVVITETTSYTLSIETETEVSFGFATQTVPGVPGCSNVLPSFNGATATPFMPSAISGTLSAGTYYIVAFGTTNSECGGEYTLSFRPQVPDCPPGSIQESEPVPFDDFISLDGTTNDACIIGGDTFQDISVGDTVCGTTGTYFESAFSSNFGDQDLYRFNIASPTVVEAEIVSTTKVRAAFTATPLPATDFCSIILAGGDASVDAEPGQPARVRIALQPGDHSLQVLAEPFAQSGTASGSPYIVSLNEYTCRADTNLDGVVSPADFNAWILAFNTQGPVCDQNGDGNCTPSDFNAWILNYNTLAGCGS